ncbi:hypothetical protein QF002_001296 [Paraburkholderia youngii]
MHSSKTFRDAKPGLAQYTGRGGRCTTTGQTVNVRGPARNGYSMIEVVLPDGHSIVIPVKSRNLAQMQPQLF